MTGAEGLSGGIAKANLNVLHALVKFCKAQGLRFVVLSLLEKECHRPLFLKEEVVFKSFDGNKWAFTKSLLSTISCNSVICFDHVGLALPLLPLAFTGLIKTVIFAHGSESWKRLRMMNSWSFRCASMVFTNSDYTLAKMRQRIARFKGRACPLGLSPDFPMNEVIPHPSGDSISLEAVDGKIYPMGQKFLLLVGRMITPRKGSEEGQKGHRFLMNILPRLLEEFSDVKLVFPGTGDDVAHLKQLARSKNVASSVFFPGQVSLEMLGKFYQHCYAYVMPSLQEGFGLAYLEAMNYGKACVGCFDQGAEDIIIHGKTGFLIKNPNDSNELLESLRHLLKDSNLADTFGKNGFKRLHENFTTGHYQNRIKEALDLVWENMFH